MKKLILWLAVSAAVMAALPWLAVTFIKGDGGMAACFILFFALDPLYAVISGIYAGKDIQKLWALPIVTALLFVAGSWLLFDIRERAFILYAFIYLVLGTAAMLVTFFMKKKQ